MEAIATTYSDVLFRLSEERDLDPSFDVLTSSFAIFLSALVFRMILYPVRDQWPSHSGLFQDTVAWSDVAVI
jgi:hypothetical protein